jgi:glutamate formiminotransferase
VDPPLLLTVPNASEGRDAAAIEAIGGAFAARADGALHLLDVHSDPDHDRSVFTLAAGQGAVARGLVAGAAEAIERIYIREHGGVHPHVGALDVAPVVYLDDGDRGAACAEALTAAALIGDDLEVPVFLYGELATAPERRERAALREGGPERLAERMRSGELAADFGPARAHPTAGATLVTARPPLVAFNVDLDTDDLRLARQIAAELREQGGGLPGVRAIGLPLETRGRAQVSFNVHDHRAAPLGELVAAVRAKAPVAEAELIGLAPRAALDGFPDEIPLRGFDPEKHVIENALRSVR